MGNFFKGIAFVYLFVSTFTYAITTADLNWREIEEDLLLEDRAFSGSFSDKVEWQTPLCNASTHYTVGFSTHLDKLFIKVIGPNDLEVRAELKDIYGRIDATHRSPATFCFTTPGWLGASSKWGRVKAIVHLDGQGLKNVKVKITQTELSRLGLGEFVPSWLAHEATIYVNQALREIWPSQFGEMLSNEISKYIRKNIPDLDE